MAFDPIVAAAVEGGGYISVIKIVPPLIVLALWGRLLTWADKDMVDAHLPRIPLNVSFLCAMVVAYGLFFLLPGGFIVGFVALLLVFLAEAGTYLMLRQKKVGLADLKEQFNAWIASFSSGKDKKVKEIPNQVTIAG